MLGFYSFAGVRMPHCYSVLRLFLSSMTVSALCCGHHCCAAAMAWRISKGSAVNLRAAHICLDKAHRLFLPHCWKVMNQQTGQRSHGSTGSCFFLGLTILFSFICIRWHSKLGPYHYDRMGRLWNHQQLIYCQDKVFCIQKPVNQVRVESWCLLGETTVDTDTNMPVQAH